MQRFKVKKKRRKIHSKNISRTNGSCGASSKKSIGSKSKYRGQGQ